MNETVEFLAVFLLALGVLGIVGLFGTAHYKRRAEARRLKRHFAAKRTDA